MLYFSFCVLITLGYNIELHTFKIKLLNEHPIQALSEQLGSLKEKSMGGNKEGLHREEEEEGNVLVYS